MILIWSHRSASPESLHKMQVREMGPLLAAADFSPFLYMGETLVEFHICGTAPDSMKRSNRTFRIGTNSDIFSCNMTGLILSGPAAFLGLRFFRSFSKPASEFKRILHMYYCGTSKSHPRTKIICQKRGSVEFLTKLFRSEGGISLSLNNTS